MATMQHSYVLIPTLEILNCQQGNFAKSSLVVLEKQEHQVSETAGNASVIVRDGPFPPKIGNLLYGIGRTQVVGRRVSTAG